MSKNKTELKKAVEIVQEITSKRKYHAYVLTGAGVSKASGIPTFRGEDGFWEVYDFDEVGTKAAWMRDPAKIWQLLHEGANIVLDAKPNPAHTAIAKLEERGIIQHTITQNIDSLHQKAGSKKVLELHGNLSRIVCIKCNKQYSLDDLPEELPPKCDCGGILRPDVVLFDETLPEKEIRHAFSVARKADLAIIVGTSAEVIPAASLPYLSKKSRAKIIIFNTEITDHKQIADVYIHGKCEKWLPIFTEEIIKEM